MSHVHAAHGCQSARAARVRSTVLLPARDARRASERRWRIASGLLLTVFAFVLLAPSTARAQVLIALLLGDKVSNEKVQLGFNVSFVLTGFAGVDGKPRRTWGAGLYTEFKLSEQFHIQPELVLKSPGGERKLDANVPGYPFEATDDETINELVQNGTVIRELKYISLPVYAKWVVGPIGLGLGPQLSVLLRAKDAVEQKTDAGTLRLTASSVDEMKRWDIGIAGSVDYAFSPEQGMRSFRLRAKGAMGFADIVKAGGKDVRNWAFGLGIDIPVGGASSPTPKANAKALAHHEHRL